MGATEKNAADVPAANAKTDDWLGRVEGIAVDFPCSGCTEVIGLSGDEEGVEDALIHRMALYADCGTSC